LKLYTRSDDESLLAQFSATPENISLETLQNCAKEGLQLYRDIDAYAPDPKAKVAVWYGAKEPNMKKAVQKLRRAFPALELHPFEGFGHGEIIAHPELMAAEIREFIGGMDDGR
jgi:pimeloyl-ACP methyl ester carboxylesterase